MTMLMLAIKIKRSLVLLGATTGTILLNGSALQPSTVLTLWTKVLLDRRQLRHLRLFLLHL
jgi:hypothetical protein